MLKLKRNPDDECSFIDDDGRILYVNERTLRAINDFTEILTRLDNKIETIRKEVRDIKDYFHIS